MYFMIIILYELEYFIMITYISDNIGLRQVDFFLLIFKIFCTCHYFDTFHYSSVLHEDDKVHSSWGCRELRLVNDIKPSLPYHEPRREKTGFLHMRKQRRRSASR